MFVIFVTIFLFSLVQPVSALEIDGKDLPDSINIADTPLILNGAGLRTKFFFNIYAGGLYLPAPSHDPAAIINADEPMLVRMYFIYDGVSAKKLKNGWEEGFAVTAPDADEKLRQAMASFVALFDKETRENDVYDISWRPGKGVAVVFNGKFLGTIPGLDFKKALFGIWLGKDPVDDDLKEGMLGR